MNRFKKTIACLIAICIALSLSACSGGKDEYESLQGFEFHFYTEEYEEKYSTVSKTLSLDANTDYQLQLDATCEGGTMEIYILYEDTNENTFSVNEDSPCSELLTIPAGTASEVTVTVSIEPETEGEVIGDLMSKSKQ